MNKLKTILIVAVVGLAICNLKAQDGIAIKPDLASTSVGRVLKSLENSPDVILSSNFTFIAYASHAKGLKDSSGHDASWGGGIALLYNVNDYVGAAWRVQYLAGEVSTMALTAQLKTSKKLGPLTLTPFAYAGPSLAMTGTQSDGNLSLVYGVGASIAYRVNADNDVGIAYAIEFNPGVNVNQIEHFGPKWTRRF